MSNKAPPQPGTSATIALSEQSIARAQPNQGLPLDSAQLTPPVTLEADATTAPARITSGHCDNGDENDDGNDRTNRPQSGSVNVTIKPHGRSSDAGCVNIRKTEKRLLRETGRAIADFRMIEQGDSIMVCLSGGKDSYTLLNLLLKLQKKAPVNFRLVAVNLDQKQPGFPTHILPDYLNGLGVEWDVIEQDTYSTVKRVVAEGKTMCGLCSRLRRGTLYGYARANGFNKIALGHHRDDIIETFFLNLFHGGSLKAMPPKLRSDDGRNTVIRPLAYCRESDIERFAKHHQFPIIPCNLCGSQSHLQRVATKKMLAQWQRQFPGRIESIFRALGNISPSQLADRTLFDFDNFKRRGQETLDAAESEAAADVEPESTDAKQWVHLSDRS